MKSKFCVKKCQENLLQFMFLYIIRTPLLELKSVGKKCGLYTGKDGIHIPEINMDEVRTIISAITNSASGYDELPASLSSHFCPTIFLKKMNNLYKTIVPFL